MLHCSEYNLNDRGTIISLLTHGIPKDVFTSKYDQDHRVNAQPWKISLDESINQNPAGYQDPVARANYYSLPSAEQADDDSNGRSIMDSSKEYDNSEVFGSHDIDHVMTSYAKTFLFAMAQNCNAYEADEFGQDAFQKAQYNGVFVQNTNHVILENPKHVYYGYYHEDSKSGAEFLIFNVYNNELTLRDAIWVHELTEMRGLPLGTPDKAINALKSLWIAQSTKYNIDKDANQTMIRNKKAALPKPFARLMGELLINITSVNKHTGPISCTYGELVRFYHEVRAGKLTSKTRNVQEWLFSQRTRISKGSREQKILQILKLRPNYKQVVNGIREIPKSRIPKLRKLFRRDKLYGRNGRSYGFHLAHVYQMNYPQKQVKGLHHITLVHGTNSSSIPTIIFDGLKTHAELVRDHATNFTDTAQAMGEGVYMANPAQFTKSLNYSNYGDAEYKFIIITDVAFSKPAKVQNYEIPDHPYDMIFADHVGPSYGYSEYLARNSNQIRIKYVLAFRKNHRKHKKN